MHPELFSLPDGIPVIGGMKITTYGFFMMLGFLTAVWFAMKRAMKVKADPDAVLNLSMIGLFAGVAGARIFFVVHYWRSDFADQPNPLFAAIDLRAGGLEFLGGFLGAAVGITLYLAIKKLSIRMYLDILAPTAMLGLAFGRIGCLFNGCCFGGVCTVEDAQVAKYPWAIRFPYASAASYRQWEERQITMPAELLITNEATQVAAIVPREALDMTAEQRLGPQRDLRLAAETLEEVRQAGAEPEQVKALGADVERLKRRLATHKAEHRIPLLEGAQLYPSRVHPERPTSPSELRHLAVTARSLPVHPTQLYSSINALLLFFLLSGVFYVRKRHGLVIGLVFVLYPISRTLLEMIRTDNPHHAGGLTASQLVSLAMFLGGVVYLFVLYRYLPLRSPYAVPYVPPEPEPA